MAELHVDIVSAEGHIYTGPASMVFAPAEMGEVGVAPRHAPLLTRLKPGAVRVQNKGEPEKAFYVTGGILEIQPDMVTVLADTALRAEDADEARVAEVKRAAEERLKTATGTDLAAAQMDLVEANARMKFVQDLKKIR